MTASNASGISLDRARLARLCEMLRSDNEQERATAARMASNALQSAGLSWTDLITRSATDQRSSQSGARPQGSPRGDASYAGSWERHEKQRYASWQGVEIAAVTEKLFEARHRLTSWECLEVKQFEGRSTLTATQWEKLEGLARKAKVWTKLGGSRAKRKAKPKSSNRGGGQYSSRRTW